MPKTVVDVNESAAPGMQPSMNMRRRPGSRITRLLTDHRRNSTVRGVHAQSEQGAEGLPS